MAKYLFLILLIIPTMVWAQVPPGSSIISSNPKLALDPVYQDTLKLCMRGSQSPLFKDALYASKQSFGILGLFDLGSGIDLWKKRFISSHLTKILNSEAFYGALETCQPNHPRLRSLFVLNFIIADIVGTSGGLAAGYALSPFRVLGWIKAGAPMAFKAILALGGTYVSWKIYRIFMDVRHETDDLQFRQSQDDFSNKIMDLALKIEADLSELEHTQDPAKRAQLQIEIDRLKAEQRAVLQGPISP